MLASVVITNYNYGRFLREAIDSALTQTYADVEVVVVDDGSTDDSRAAIATYGGRVACVLKENGGQSSAMNAGFEASRGDVVSFLDADDALEAQAIANAVAVLGPGVSKVHWPQALVDRSGRRTGDVVPKGALPEGDLRERTVKEGPDTTAVTGALWTRGFLRRVLPMPELERSRGVGGGFADTYLAALAPVYGSIRALNEPQTVYRVHGENDYANSPFAQKLERDLWVYDLCDELARHLRATAADPDPEEWKRNSWLHRFVEARSLLEELIPAGATLILVDSNGVGPELPRGRNVLPFLERGGAYWGAPADDDNAIAELERLRRKKGARFIAFAWPAFWWLDHYTGFQLHLRRNYRLVANDERLIVFDLRQVA